MDSVTSLKLTRFQASENTFLLMKPSFVACFFLDKKVHLSEVVLDPWRQARMADPYGREKNALFFFIDNVSFFIHWLRYVVFLEKQYFKKTYT